MPRCCTIAECPPPICIATRSTSWIGRVQNSIALKGSELLDQSPPLAHLAPLIRYHHSHWDALHRLDSFPNRSPG